MVKVDDEVGDVKVNAFCFSKKLRTEKLKVIPLNIAPIYIYSI